MELPDDVWDLIKKNTFSRIGSSFLKCTVCKKDIIQMFETKPFVKNLKTTCRFYKGKLLTNRGNILEHSDACVNNSHILTLEYSENVIKCTPKVTPTCIVLNNKNNIDSFICFENKHKQIIQLQPYHTFLDTQNNSVHVCVICRHEKRILFRYFTRLKMYCQLHIAHSSIS